MFWICSINLLKLLKKVDFLKYFWVCAKTSNKLFKQNFISAFNLIEKICFTTNKIVHLTKVKINKHKKVY